MIVLGLTVGLLQENCYILGCKETARAAIVDPGDNARAILRAVTERNLTVDKIINTHAHLDHVMAVDPDSVRHRRTLLSAPGRLAHVARRTAPGAAVA